MGTRERNGRLRQACRRKTLFWLFIGNSPSSLASPHIKCAVSVTIFALKCPSPHTHTKIGLKKKCWHSSLCSKDNLSSFQVQKCILATYFWSILGWGGGPQGCVVGQPQLQPCEAAVRRGEQSYSGKKIKFKTTASFDLSICFILA